jgi:hypothetical protein
MQHAHAHIDGKKEKKRERERGWARLVTGPQVQSRILISIPWFAIYDIRFLPGRKSP